MAAKIIGRRPVTKEYPVTCPFGRTGAYWAGGTHKGVDFGCPKRTPVESYNAGIVAKAGDYGDAFGKYVRVDHPEGHHTYYTHLDEIFVVEGAPVSEGTVLGLSGNSGNVTHNGHQVTDEERAQGLGAHLHFELRIGKQSYDPNWRNV